jgi:hypothetical protein
MAILRNAASITDLTENRKRILVLTFLAFAAML